MRRGVPAHPARFAESFNDFVESFYRAALQSAIIYPRRRKQSRRQASTLGFCSREVRLGRVRGSARREQEQEVCSESDHPIDPVNVENRTRSGETAPPIYGIQ